MTATTSLPVSAGSRVLVLGPPARADELGQLLQGEGLCTVTEQTDPTAVGAADMAVLDLPFGGSAALETLAFWQRLPEDQRPAVLSLYVDPAHRPLALSVGDALRVPYDGQEFKDRVLALVRWHSSWRRALIATRKLDEARALLRETEERLSKIEARTAAATKSNSEIAAYLAHELRTPLNVILGFSDILKEQRFGPVGNARYVGYAVDIYNSAAHLARVCEDAMNLAKAEAGQDQLKIENVDIVAVFDRAVSMVRGLSESSGVRLKVEIEPEFPMLRTDGSKLLQIVLNLATNAIKFTPSGGRVKLKARTDRARGALILIIRDTGIGMAQQDVATAMRPFGQVGQPIRGRPQGIGLGLPLTRAIVERLGGRLGIATQPGAGTVITVQFPNVIAAAA